MEPAGRSQEPAPKSDVSPNAHLQQMPGNAGNMGEMFGIMLSQFFSSFNQHGLVPQPIAAPPQQPNVSSPQQPNVSSPQQPNVAALQPPNVPATQPNTNETNIIDSPPLSEEEDDPTPPQELFARPENFVKFDDDPSRCSVCLEPMPLLAAVVQSCCHVFCEGCVLNILESSVKRCPQCQITFRTYKPVQF